MINMAITKQNVRRLCRLIMLTILPVIAVTPSWPEEAAPFRVGGLEFVAPNDWQRLATTTAMRKAEFSIPDENGRRGGYCVFYHFGPGKGGSIAANLTRWRQQFREIDDTLGEIVEHREVDGHQLHYFEASGSFLAGRPGQAKRVVPAHTFMGAIIEAPAGNIFVRLVVPNTMRVDAREDFRRMVASPFAPQ